MKLPLKLRSTILNSLASQLALHPIGQFASNWMLVKNMCGIEPGKRGQAVWCSL
ncbi:MAG: hypothetical protein RMK18_11270 [Armatimonadota bacterium]|nr:hypothetical protein [Armatimonadota bacterium]MDW8026428.1 hypothetical protein [Armatimonadota bacterium]